MNERSRRRAGKKPVLRKAPARPANDRADPGGLDKRLDEALAETFPASDPIAVTPPGHNTRAQDD
jgi:hypothetical protein